MIQKSIQNVRQNIRQNVRLDKFLAEYKFVKSRTLAQKVIESKSVYINNVIITKLDYDININDYNNKNINVVIKDNTIDKYVSRGALKLLGAITDFNLSLDFFKDKVCIDIGCSTGGFTQVLLESGVKKVYAIDVGRDQFDKSLIDKYGINKIELFESADIRDFAKTKSPLEFNKNLYDNYFDIIVTDISFISLYKILPEIKIFLKKDGYAILLLKPQFELDNKEERLKYQNTKGIIKESLQTQFYQELKDRYKIYIINQGLAIIDIIASPIDGGDGNKEFLIFIKK